MKTFKTTFFLIAIGMILFTSCSTDESVLTEAVKVTERIDIAIEGTSKEIVYIQSDVTNNNANLIDYTLYPSNANKMDIHVNIDENRTLVFKLNNNSPLNPWEEVGSYNVYNNQDVQNKSKFVTVELLNNNHEAQTFSTNDSQTKLNVFSIVEYNAATNEILCRINELPLEGNHTEETVLITGTFRGAVTF